MTKKSEEPDWPCPTGRLPILGEHRPISLYCSSCSEFCSFIFPSSCRLAPCSWHKCPTALGTTMLRRNWCALPWPPALTAPCSQTGQSTGPWMTQQGASPLPTTLNLSEPFSFSWYWGEGLAIFLVWTWFLVLFCFGVFFEEDNSLILVYVKKKPNQTKRQLPQKMHAIFFCCDLTLVRY